MPEIESCEVIVVTKIVGAISCSSSESNIINAISTSSHIKIIIILNIVHRYVKYGVSPVYISHNPMIPLIYFCCSIDYLLFTIVEEINITSEVPETVLNYSNSSQWTTRNNITDNTPTTSSRWNVTITACAASLTNASLQRIVVSLFLASQKC